jgi:DNA topoisomerase-1
VQSVAVRLICDREQEIQAFVPEEYWTLTGQFQADKRAGSRFLAKLISLNGEKLTISNQAEMEKVLLELEGAQFQVTQIKKRQTRRNPAPPFTTSTLQQEAYRKLNFTARRTMRVAQQLYEGLAIGKEGIVGLISYIRTDSTRVSPEIQQQARAFIAQKYGAEFVSPQPRIYASGKKAQDAHESIRPTSVLREPDSVKDLLTSEQFRLYRLIWERFVASQMSSAVLDQTRIDISGAGKAGEGLAVQDKHLNEAVVYGFRANGSIVRFPGFMQVYVEGRDDEGKEGTTLLPELTEGQSLKAVKLEDKQHFTQPPPRYGEATLVKTLEEKGIGRPSTYAPTIETIVSRGYVLRQEKQFVPTELGFLVVDMLKQYFPAIIDLEFTAELEEKLDQVEEGKFPWKQLIREFYFPFKETLDYADAQIGRVELTDEESEEPCPKCGRLMVIKRGPFGRFLACPGFPECQTTKPILEEIGVECPRCGGQVVVRHSKKGRKFFGCSKFPECNFVAWQQPTGEKCPQCGDLLMEKSARGKGKYLVCVSSECGYRSDGQPPVKRRAKAVGADSETKTKPKSKSKTKTKTAKAASSRKTAAKTAAASKTKTKASPKSAAKNTAAEAEKASTKRRTKKSAIEAELNAGTEGLTGKTKSKEPTGKTKTAAKTRAKANAPTSA